ncbi:hypothetical protein KR093_003067, partial [Drosophila rubida]
QRLKIEWNDKSVNGTQVKVPAQIVKSLKIELNYESILVVHNKLAACVVELEDYATTPIINFNENQNFSIKASFNRRFLVLVCLGNRSNAVLKVLSKNLEGMRDAAILLIANNHVDRSLTNVFKYCFKYKMLNVLAIRNWGQDRHIYSYRAFPNLILIKRHISEVERFFVSQLKDISGYPIVSMPDNILPRSVYFKDAQGQPQFSGYLARFIKEFARSLNATLSIPWCHVPLDRPEEMIIHDSISLMTKGVVDIPMSIINIATAFDESSLICSYVVEISAWQLLLPMEAELRSELMVLASANEFHVYFGILVILLFTLVLHFTTCLELGEWSYLGWLNLLIDPVLKTILNQAFVLPRRSSIMWKFIYCMMMLFGLLSYNIYLAQLEMNIIHPPRRPPLRTYEDLRKVGLKILMSPDDRYMMQDTLGREHMNAFWDVYEVVNRSFFQVMRRQPNSSYAYPITHTLWPLIERKYAKLPYPSFRISKEFTFIDLVPFGLPLPRNSIYEEALNRFILNTHCSGLYENWFHRTFQHLVEIGKMEVLPYQSIEETVHMLCWKDLYVISVVASIHICIAIIVFVFEVAMGNVHRYIYNNSRA